MARARQLIARELGIKAKELSMPESYNGNPNFPWYELKMGNQAITVTYNAGGTFSKGNELIILTVTYENSLSSVSEYFYTDTMEFCEEFTDQKKYEDLCDRMGITGIDEKLKRLACEAYRHTFATRAVEGDMNTKALAAIMGHENEAFTLKQYTKAQDEFLHTQMNRMETSPQKKAFHVQLVRVKCHK